MESLRYRTIWISDVHLGTRFCKAEYLLDFLKHNDAQYLYLVGDIIDVWNLKNGWHWPAAHSEVIQVIMHKAAHGTRVTYIPGNHDEIFRDHIGRVFGGVHVATDAVHVTADGRRLLILHGDEFDGIVKHSKWLAYVGSWMYETLLSVNRSVNLVRRRLGFSYWSLSAYLKHKVKNAVNFISNFEKAVVHEARKRQVDGVVCGHIHKAAMEYTDGILYCNDGDWVESCTALVEQHDGSLAIIHWADQSAYLLEEAIHEHSPGNRRLVSADQRGGPHPGTHEQGAGASRPHRSAYRAR